MVQPRWPHYDGVQLDRRYFTCPACGQGDFGGDRVLGLEGYLTAAARRMACLAGDAAVVRRGEALLAELAGWDLDDETIRRLCHAEAARADGRPGGTGDGRGVRRRPGNWELQIDAGKVDTEEGWRDVKAAVYAHRERGARADAAGWDQRDLPAPRSVGDRGGRGGVGVRRAMRGGGRGGWGLSDPTLLSVSGDGAAWIWNEWGVISGGVGEPGRLTRGRARGGGGPTAVRRGDGGSAGAGRARADAAVGGRLLGGGGVGRRVGRPCAGGRGRGGVGGGLELLRGASGAPELRLVTTPGSVDRQRPDRGNDQAGGEPAVETDQGTMEGGARRTLGGTVRPGGWTRVASLLEGDATHRRAALTGRGKSRTLPHQQKP